MIIEFTKAADRRTVLKCIRDDGSVTWQRNENQQARFFPVHDLLHYAIETELGFSQGFFGLIASGWNIEETTGKSPRGSLPDETLEVEHLVSSFTAEWNSDTNWTAADFNETNTTFAKNRGWPIPRMLTDDDLSRVRSRCQELFARWRDLPVGEKLELRFQITPPGRSNS